MAAFGQATGWRGPWPRRWIPIGARSVVHALSSLRRAPSQRRVALSQETRCARHMSLSGDLVAGRDRPLCWPGLAGVSWPRTTSDRRGALVAVRRQPQPHCQRRTDPAEVPEVRLCHRGGRSRAAAILRWSGARLPNRPTVTVVAARLWPARKSIPSRGTAFARFNLLKFKRDWSRPLLSSYQ